MEALMSRILVVILAVVVAFGAAAPSLAQPDTLEKIKSTGVLTIGTRTGSPPFAYVNKNNEWVGFTIDLVEQVVKPSVEKAVGRQIKVEKKESTPPTRIPLLTSNAVDLIAGTMTDTPQRRESVDGVARQERDRKSTRLNSSHLVISYAVFCLKKKINIMDCY